MTGKKTFASLIRINRYTGFLATYQYIKRLSHGESVSISWNMKIYWPMNCKVETFNAGHQGYQI